MCRNWMVLIYTFNLLQRLRNTNVRVLNWTTWNVNCFLISIWQFGGADEKRCCQISSCVFAIVRNSSTKMPKSKHFWNHCIRWFMSLLHEKKYNQIISNHSRWQKLFSMSIYRNENDLIHFENIWNQFNFQTQRTNWNVGETCFVCRNGAANKSVWVSVWKKKHEHGEHGTSDNT